jgi:hypothetical protein
MDPERTFLKVDSTVADPYGMFLGLLDPDPLVRSMDPDPLVRGMGIPTEMSWMPTLVDSNEE